MMKIAIKEVIPQRHWNAFFKLPYKPHKTQQPPKLSLLICSAGATVTGGTNSSLKQFYNLLGSCTWSASSQGFSEDFFLSSYSRWEIIYSFSDRQRTHIKHQPQPQWDTTSYTIGWLLLKKNKWKSQYSLINGERLETLVHCWWECVLILWKTVWVPSNVKENY